MYNLIFDCGREESLKINAADTLELINNLIIVDLSLVKFVFQAHWSDKFDILLLLLQVIFSVYFKAYILEYSPYIYFPDLPSFIRFKRMYFIHYSVCIIYFYFFRPSLHLIKQK